MIPQTDKSWHDYRALNQNGYIGQHWRAMQLNVIARLSMLVNRPILISALQSIQVLLTLMKHLIIGLFNFSPSFTGHHLGSKLT